MWSRHNEDWRDKTDGTRVIAGDPHLEHFQDSLRHRYARYTDLKSAISQHEGGLLQFSQGYKSFGLIRQASGILYREWAPAASKMFLFGDFNGWDRSSLPLTANRFGVWSVFIPDREDGTPAIAHSTRVKALVVTHNGQHLERIPAWSTFAMQNATTQLFDAVYWSPPAEAAYKWQHAEHVERPSSLRIYECHVGMSSADECVASYDYFTDHVLPRVKRLGYTAVQIMAIMEHAYYGSFGYHVTNLFAVSSRSGTPEQLKRLIDTAHGMGLSVLMDVVHSHASSNELDGIANFDGSRSQYFHGGARGHHSLWDSRCFDYGKWEVLRFLLSNLRWWVDEYRFDGFRFDGVTSMLYVHHGINFGFTGGYHEYFGGGMDVDANVYLMLANEMLHTYLPRSMITVAEDVSGMPALCRPVEDGGLGFDYRLAMAIPDVVIELLQKVPDENWSMQRLVHTLTNRRWNEKSIAYLESHDQALVGDKTVAMWLMNDELFFNMDLRKYPSPVIERGMALHKMMRLLVYSLGGEGYLNFMGNEFGHPEWIDFPRAGNGFSYRHARRQWELVDSESHRFRQLQKFDEEMHGLESAHRFCQEAAHCWVVLHHDADKVIAIEKGDRLLIVFNFHPWKSYTNYTLGTSWHGRYKVVLDSDSWATGGAGRVPWDAHPESAPHGWNNRPNSIQIGLPSRSCQVYRCYDWYDEPKSRVEEAEVRAAADALAEHANRVNAIDRKACLAGDDKVSTATSLNVAG